MPRPAVAVPAARLISGKPLKHTPPVDALLELSGSGGDGGGALPPPPLPELPAASTNSYSAKADDGRGYGGYGWRGAGAERGYGATVIDPDLQYPSLAPAPRPLHAPAPRWLHSAVPLARGVVVFGGVSSGDFGVLGDVWHFDPEPPAPIVRAEAIDSDKAADKWLMSRLGSDEDISCVIGIEGPGTVAAKEQVDAFLTIAKDRGLVELTKDKGKAPTGNKIWHGHYFVKLSGNGVNTFEVGCVPLANDAIEYINKADAADVKAQVLYMMLCARNAERLLADPAKFPEAKETLRAICEARGLLDWSKFQVSPINEDGHLRCWSEHEMSAENFLCSTKSQSHAQKCHVDSVAAARLDFDPETKKLKTCAKPYGFMWGIARFNMLQGEGSIEDARHDLRLDENARLRKENAELRRQLAQLKGI
jgi:hypothetical protein